MSEHSKIAKIIHGQLGWMGQAVIWSWGARQWAAMPATERLGASMLAGLKFRVSGRNFKGYVIVWLCGDDTYTVELGNFNRKKLEFVTKHAIKDIYCDQLADTVDRLVERGDQCQTN